MSGPDGERRPADPTIADVMNGFSFDSGRKTKRRRWGRRREQQVEPETTPTEEPGPATELDQFDEPELEPAIETAAVRPYTWTRGRTSTNYQLAVETLVSTSPRGRDQLGLLQVEHRAVAELCQHVRSVAEVAALLPVPLGVARVLLGDMAGLGLVIVHQRSGTAGNVPDLALMERVLSGLRRL